MADQTVARYRKQVGQAVERWSEKRAQANKSILWATKEIARVEALLGCATEIGKKYDADIERLKQECTKLVQLGSHVSRHPSHAGRWPRDVHLHLRFPALARRRGFRSSAVPGRTSVPTRRAALDPHVRGSYSRPGRRTRLPSRHRS